MKAMILAAGRGDRLRPLTDKIPKALVPVNGVPLIVYHLKALAYAGVTDVVINLAHLSDVIKSTLGCGEQFGLDIHYSCEVAPGLGTGGGILQALSLLGDEPFIVVNCDVFTDYDFSQLITRDIDMAHLVLTRNPPHNPQGDFGLQDGFAIESDSDEKLTFSGISIMNPRLFQHAKLGKFPVTDLLRPAMRAQLVSAECLSGVWIDVGTQARVVQAEAASTGRG